MFLLRFITYAVERIVSAMAIALFHYGKTDAKPFCDQRGEENCSIKKELPSPLCFEVSEQERPLTYEIPWNYDISWGGTRGWYLLREVRFLDTELPHAGPQRVGMEAES